ncbi:hypothetical protein D3C83_133590 [compost metagenome]
MVYAQALRRGADLGGAIADGPVHFVRHAALGQQVDRARHAFGRLILVPGRAVVLIHETRDVP